MWKKLSLFTYNSFLKERDFYSPEEIINEIKDKQEKIIEAGILPSSSKIAQSYLEYAYQLASLEENLSGLYWFISWVAFALLILSARFFIDFQNLIDFLFSQGKKKGFLKPCWLMLLNHPQA